MASVTLAKPSAHPAHSVPSHPSASEPAMSRADEPPLDTSMLKVVAQRALIDALNSVNGAKTLVLDPSLAGPLGLVTEVSLLKHHGVDKMFWLESGPLNATTTNVVYLCRPQIKWMKIVADQIKRLSQGSTSHTYTLLLVPRRTTLCDRILEEEGVLGEVNISSYKLEFIPLETDLISLEWENTYRELYLDGDTTSIFYAAQALITIQQAYGLFPRILGKGDGAKKLADLLARFRPPASSKSPATLTNTSETIDSLIIIDRSVDMITPLLTQLTYQGLVDEYFGIKNSHVEVDATLLSAPPAESTSPSAGPNPTLPGSTTSLPTTSTQKKKKHHLASEDHLFAQLQDSNFAVVGGMLNKEARRLDAEYKGRHQAQTVTQLRDFVGKLGGLQNEHQALRLHTGLSEEISKFTHTEQFNRSLEVQQNLLQGYDTSAQLSAIDDLVAQHAPIQIVLRLLILANLTTGGIKAKALENLKREILQTYGYSYLPLLLNLSSLSLITSLPLPKPSAAAGAKSTPPPPPPFGPIRKSLRLLSDTLETSPTDISYVYSGYAPLSVRLVQCVAQKGSVLASTDRDGGASGTEETGPNMLPAHPITGWKGFEDALKSLPGETVDRTQTAAVPSDAGDNMKSTAAPMPREGSTTTMVFFLGGCTYTEIAALRWMAQQNRGRRFLIGTTGIVNGTSLLESLGPSGTKFGPVV